MTLTARKTATLLIASAVALSLAACADSDEGPGSDECAIVFRGSSDRPPAEQDAYQQVIEGFGEAYDCDVTVNFQGTWDEITQQVTSARIADEPLDVIMTSTSTRDMAEAGMLTDLTECVAGFEDRFLETALASFEYGDRQYAAPFSSLDTSAIFYNKSLFDELGLEPPTTYEEFVAAGQAIRDGSDMTPIIHQGQSPWYWSMWFMAAFGETSGAASIEMTQDFLAGNRPFDSAEEVAALEALAQFTEDGLMERATLDTDAEGMRAAFLQERSAMFFGLTPELVNLRLAEPDFEVGILEFPRVTSMDAEMQVGGAPKDALAITSFASETNKQAGCQLIEYMSRPENAQIVVGSQDPFISSVNSVDPSSDEPLVGQLNDDFAPHTVIYLDWIWPGQINDAVRNAIIDVMFNDVDPADAAGNVQAAYDSLVAQEDYAYAWWEDKPQGFWDEISFENTPEPEIQD